MVISRREPLLTDRRASSRAERRVRLDQFEEQKVHVVEYRAGGRGECKGGGC